MTTSTDTMGGLLDDAARQWPDKVALNFPALAEVLTFGDLYSRVIRAAALLRSRGVRPGSTIAVLLQNRPEFAIIWLAAARIGAAVAPINARYVADEVDYVLGHSEAVVLVTEKEFGPVVDAIETPIEVLDHQEVRAAPVSSLPEDTDVPGDT